MKRSSPEVMVPAFEVVLVGILAQRRICDRQGIEILQDGDFII